MPSSRLSRLVRAAAAAATTAALVLGAA
ncbi:MAG: hypothetical protein QOK14_1889, partial [Frankiaceae bacterium]|nr:hypothetical protein [Frankiaceae bacterium]